MNNEELDYYVLKEELLKQQLEDNEISEETYIKGIDEISKQIKYNPSN